MRLRDENKSAQIKQKAMRMVVRDGIEGFGINRLAKEVGVSPGTIYIYFKDKEDLLLNLCMEASANILESSLKDLTPDMAFEEGMKLQWENRYVFFKENPLQVQFVEKMRYTAAYKSISEKLNEDYGEVLGSFIQRAVSNAELAEMSFELYWSLAFAPLYQLINFSNSKGFLLTRSLLDDACSRVIRGLKP